MSIERRGLPSGFNGRRKDRWRAVRRFVAMDTQLELPFNPRPNGGAKAPAPLVAVPDYRPDGWDVVMREARRKWLTAGGWIEVEQMAIE
ncbi:MAG: hypothetical protein M1444_02315 [Patescibacteria group bacterium]|nr:hypothetical protein [Patescibacteria group bacterium]